MTRNQELHVICICKHMGFPFGMASAQRVRLIAKGLIQAGADVKVFCITAGEKRKDPLNKNISGNFEGIPFEFTSGQTIEASNFIERRWLKLKGLFVAIWKIWKLWMDGYKNIRLFLYGFSYKPNMSIFAITFFGNMFRIPVVLELCEAPWRLRDRRKNIFCNLPLLSGFSGVMAISQFLVDWCNKETQTSKRKINIFRIGILTELTVEGSNETKITENPSVLLACSQGYDDTVIFVLKAMLVVWEHIPQCKLVFTGSARYQPKIDEFLDKTNTDRSKIIISGYVPRSELFDLYKRSWALLIPLFNDVRSKARFPTKIAEYTSTARPIVTTNIGEIPYFFVDRQNAYVAENDNAEAFGRRILEALLSPEKAAIIGRNGLNTCEKYFDYSKYSNAMFDFFMGC